MYHRLLLTAHCALAGLLMTFSAGAAEALEKGVAPGKWTQDFAAAKAHAKKENLPLLVNFTGSDWCGWCIRIEEGVFTKPEWRKWAAANVVQVFIDFPNDESKVPEAYRARNAELSKRYGVEGFPTFVILDADGNTELDKAVGAVALEPAAFIARVEEATRYSASQVHKLAAAMGGDRKQAYVKQWESWRATQAEREKWIASGPEPTPANQAKFMDYERKIMTAKHALEDMEYGHIATTLTGKKASDLGKLYGQFKSTRDEMYGLMFANPEPTEEVVTKFRAMYENYTKMKAQLAEYR